MRFSAFCVGAAALLLAGAPASAGEYRLVELDGTVVKWGEPVPGTGATVTYAFATRSQRFDEARNCRAMDPIDVIARRSGIPMAALEHELELAFAAWQEVADVRFRRAEKPGEADILIGAQANPRGRAFANVLPSPEKASGHVVTRSSAGPTILAAGFGSAAGKPEQLPIAPIRRSLICLNPEQGWKIGFDGDTEIYDLRYTFTHEIGHTLGLDHPGASGELMSFRYEETFRSPQAGDIAGAVLLYGPSKGERGGGEEAVTRGLRAESTSAR